ncbi:alkaline shock response membrane anchor protein AmaP [Paenibacillus dokdonensis]|uniref:Alkaline shock response membrane anchor protein AmaP n=1 Tax=Paenibacillus dokdonensis TaxID=2567944 RepID=A0ABU6GUL3_9BACL|nr:MULTISPECIES: alkaline shock response membrane anchor protein AmaP [Paenibacillus]MEC0243439.1 alkaline shock response membrane anchor protein AmaP [Paenibacillus dokdonensis]
MAKILDRLLLFVYSLSIGVISVFAILRMSDLVPALGDYMDGATLQITVIVVGAVLFLLSIRFFYISIRRERVHIHSIDQRTEYGDIQISVETIENLCLKAAARIRGAKDLKARIRVTEAGLEIMIRAIVEGDVSIPSMTTDIQKQVHDYLQETTGIPVSNVAVYIANVAQSAAIKSRVE